jgi:ABC-type Na+ efflux pump permease subunit
MTPSLPAFLGTYRIGGRLSSLFADGTVLPVISGGEGEGSDGGAGGSDGNGAPDLASLERVLNEAKQNGQTEATTNVLKALGFEKLEDAQQWVKDKRDADAAAMTEAERREQAAADKERAAEERERVANQRALNATIRTALLEAGAPKDGLGDLVKLVDLTEDDDEKAKTAVETVKAKFPALFGEQGSGGGGKPAPSGVPGGKPPTKPNAKSALERGAERWGQRTKQSA